MMATPLNGIEVRLVLEAIRAKYGYDFRDYASATIQRRLQAVLAKAGIAHLGELQHRLLHQPKFFYQVLDELTIQVSDMFRDPGFFKTFRQRVVPLLRTYPQLKIWHAGCASGEEVYSIAILLTEENLYERTQLYATDVSARAVEQTRDGVYAAERLSAFNAAYRDAGGQRDFTDYYSEAYGRVAMRDSLRKNMVFFQHDLVHDYALGEMNVILCRNVMIYFEPTLRSRVVSIFKRSLCHGGFLCLGASERMPTEALGFGEFVAADRIYRLVGAR
jgi:chemotaxis protein methyltransferase CheR